jgi:hypothetical protein
MAALENKYQRTLTPNFEYGSHYWPVISEYQIRRDIMCGTFELLAKFFEKTSKLIAIRLDLKLKERTLDNQPISHFFKQFKRKLLQHYGHCYNGYVWVREQNTAAAQHYHVALFLDGQKVRHSQAIKMLASSIWQHGYLCLPQCPFYRIDRNQINRFQALIYRLSYLAKSETKGERPKQVKDYQISRSIRAR